MAKAAGKSDLDITSEYIGYLNAVEKAAADAKEKLKKDAHTFYEEHTSEIVRGSATMIAREKALRKLVSESGLVQSADQGGASTAHKGVWNELVYDDKHYAQYGDYENQFSGHSLPFDSRNHYHPLHSGQYNDVHGSESALLFGGVVGASAVAVILMIFCLGLVFGMAIYWGYSQKRKMDVKRRKDEMCWIHDNNEA
eukprot:270283_1